MLMQGLMTGATLGAVLGMSNGIVTVLFGNGFVEWTMSNIGLNGMGGQ